MAVRMRLMRMGKKRQPVYRVVVMDQRAPRDGRYIEQIGRYDARSEPSIVEIDNERAADWLAKERPYFPLLYPTEVRLASERVEEPVLPASAANTLRFLKLKK